MNSDFLSEADALAALNADEAVPAWIFDRETLSFLEVNQAAVEFYEYSRAEFLTLTILDMRPLEDVVPLLRVIFPSIRGLTVNGQKWRHQKRNGTVFPVLVNSYSTSFRGRPAQLVIANPLAGAENGPPGLFSALPNAGFSPSFLMRLKEIMAS